MDDKPFYSPNRKPPQPPKPTPGESLWTLRKGDRTESAELRTHAEGGVELQLLIDGELFLGQRCPTPARALDDEADFCRLRLEARRLVRERRRVVIAAILRFYGRRHQLRAEALAEADDCRRVIR